MSGGTLRVLLGDQCSRGIAALDGIDPAHDTVLMMEVQAECTYVPHHPQKIVLVLSAMRHFARALAARGIAVDYVRLDDAANTGKPRRRGVRAPCSATAPRASSPRIRANGACCRTCRAGRARPASLSRSAQDTRFLCALPRFRAWAKGRRQFRMEHFYREMRRETGLLMEGDEPAGGRWNFDAENRRALPRDVTPPAPLRFPPDAITREVMALVAGRFGAHFGELDGFAWPVTAKDATAALDAFIRDRLPLFGDYQDAMAAGQPTMFHALVSTSLNAGLLDPMEACQRGGTGVAGRARAAQRRGGLHPPDPRLARICARHLLAVHAGLRGHQRAGRRPPAARLLLGRADHHALHGSRRWRRPATSPMPTTSSG